MKILRHWCDMSKERRKAISVVVEPGGVRSPGSLLRSSSVRSRSIWLVTQYRTTKITQCHEFCKQVQRRLASRPAQHNITDCRTVSISTVNSRQLLLLHRLLAFQNHSTRKFYDNCALQIYFFISLLSQLAELLVQPVDSCLSVC